MSGSHHHHASSHGGEIRRVTWVGLFINLALSITKLLLGLLGGSQAVVADAVHSISDMATDFAVIIGVRFWEPPADDAHPYGHQRIETLVTLLIGLALLWAGFELAIKAVTSVPDAHREPVILIAALGPLASILFKEVLYHWTVAVGRRTGSSAVIANAWHHRSDAISSLPALVAVLVAAFFPAYAFVDRIGAVVVSVFIFKVAFDIIRPAFSELGDRGVTAGEREQIRHIALHTPGVRDIHRIRTRKMGAGNFVDLHVLVDDHLTITAGHEIAEAVRTALLTGGPSVVDVITHLEPYHDSRRNEDHDE